MPFALREAGFGFGVILIVLMGIITDFSVRVLVASGVKVNKPEYQASLPSVDNSCCCMSS